MTSQIYLAGGCFWGTEHFMKQLPGVLGTTVGYAQSIIPHPTYQQVCTGLTHAAETVRVDYDPTVISLDKLLDLYYMTIDPLSLNRQGGDSGTQYRTGIYYTDPSLRPLIDESINRLARQLNATPAIEVMPLDNFYPAELYHQDYLDNNPGGYCHISPELIAFARSLSPKQK